jgi:Domain of unknown function (DUF4159)
MRFRSPKLLATFGLLLALSAAISAQRFRVREGPGVPARFPPPNFGDGAFTHCKIMFTSVLREANGMGWATDYPYAGINLMIRLSELTKTPISKDKDGSPNYWVVRMTDDALFRCPFTMATDVGTLEFSPAEATRLREYLLKGGFLWVDDFWGTHAWQQWSHEMQKVLPEFPIVDVPPEHPLRHTLFQIAHVPQVTSINFWRGSGGTTSERGSDSPQANLRMISDDKGRVMVLMTHNTDIGDSWEREGEDHEFFLQFSPDGYALGIDVVLYALTH